MLLPSKAIPADQAVIAVGAQILTQLDDPGSVSAVWERLSSWRTQNKMDSALPFWWYALTLDFLYTTGAIELHGGQLVKVRSAHAAEVD